MEPILVMPKRENTESGCNRDLSDKEKSSNCASRVNMKESIDPSWNAENELPRRAKLLSNRGNPRFE